VSGRTGLCVRTDASARTLGRADASVQTRLCIPTSLPLALPRTPSLALPRVRADGLLRPRKRGVDAKKLIIKKFIFICLVAGLKREEKNVQFSVFNPQDPRAPRASRMKPREEKGLFGLVPLVTHPSSIPLLGGLTPKFLSLSFHSLQGLLMLMASGVGTLWSLGNLIDLELNLCSIESNEGVTTNIIIIAP
jgi:hypothetical protein